MKLEVDIHVGPPETRDMGGVVEFSSAEEAEEFFDLIFHVLDGCTPVKRAVEALQSVSGYQTIGMEEKGMYAWQERKN